ncbi:hypothetical protein RFI_26695 [Reticulomyxa filosa]|uniref:Uncharacterized protein n=1 Tax=Reticulomyxa filosa TaxID=46433 RepID=X6MB33_RETFI|nr:hypothetical protein RFI_26695 [Reticulomyxa filosa]|eukprot:ETO10682.1 hypothetical protein RFI_26695 [Reticulomyxa filosa]
MAVPNFFAGVALLVLLVILSPIVCYLMYCYSVHKNQAYFKKRYYKLVEWQLMLSLFTIYSCAYFLGLFVYQSNGKYDPKSVVSIGWLFIDVLNIASWFAVWKLFVVRTYALWLSTEQNKEMVERAWRMYMSAEERIHLVRSNKPGSNETLQNQITLSNNNKDQESTQRNVSITEKDSQNTKISETCATVAIASEKKNTIKVRRDIQQSLYWAIRCAAVAFLVELGLFAFLYNAYFVQQWRAWFWFLFVNCCVNWFIFRLWKRFPKFHDQYHIRNFFFFFFNLLFYYLLFYFAIT